MKKQILILLSVLCVGTAYAATPYLAVPDLVYEHGVKNYGVTNADVKNALIKSGKFKLMHTPKNYNATAVIAEINSKQLVIESEEHDVKLKTTMNNDKHTPKYILIGEVVSSELGENSYKIKNTTNVSAAKTLSLSAEYSLIDIADNALVSSFNVHASASQTMLLDSTNSQFNANISKLVKETSQDLAQQVINELNNSKVNMETDAPIVKNFSTID